MYYLGIFDDVVHRYALKPERQLHFEEVQQTLIRLAIMSPGQWLLNDGFLLHSPGGQEAFMNKEDSLLHSFLQGGLVRLERKNPDVRKTIKDRIDAGVGSYQRFNEYLGTKEGKVFLGFLDNIHEEKTGVSWGAWDTNSAFLLLAAHALKRLDHDDGVCRRFFFPFDDLLERCLQGFLRVAGSWQKKGRGFGARDLFERVAFECVSEVSPAGEFDNKPPQVSRFLTSSIESRVAMTRVMQVANEIYHTAHALCHATVKEIPDKGRRRPVRRVRSGYGALTYSSPLFVDLHAGIAANREPGGIGEMLERVPVPVLPLDKLFAPANRRVFKNLAVESHDLAKARQAWANRLFDPNWTPSETGTEEWKLLANKYEKTVAEALEFKRREDTEKILSPFRREDGDVVVNKLVECAAKHGSDFATGAVAGAGVYLGLSGMSDQLPAQQVEWLKAIGTGGGGSIGAISGGLSCCWFAHVREGYRRRRYKRDFKAAAFDKSIVDGMREFRVIQLCPSRCSGIAAKLQEFKSR